MPRKELSSLANASTLPRRKASSSFCRCATTTELSSLVVEKGASTLSNPSGGNGQEFICANLKMNHNCSSRNARFAWLKLEPLRCVCLTTRSNYSLISLGFKHFCVLKNLTYVRPRVPTHCHCGMFGRRYSCRFNNISSVRVIGTRIILGSFL